MPRTDERTERTDGGAGPRDAVAPPGPLIVVSNRQPYRHEFVQDADGGSGGATDADSSDDPVVTVDGERIAVDEPTGGLTAGLDPILQRSGGTWIAWGDGDADRHVSDEDDRVEVPPGDESYTLRRLWLSDDAVDGYYYGFSNRVLWPLCHGLPDLVEERSDDLEWYRRVNREFADAVSEAVAAETTDEGAAVASSDGGTGETTSEEPIVWLQDYHLGLAPAMIAEAVPSNVTVAQFWHIPWPSPAVFRRCPASRELLEGLLGNDLLGFHVDRYRTAFLESVARFVPDASVDRDRSTVRYDGSETRVVSDPMGVDADAYDSRSRAIDDDRWADLRERYDVPSDVAIGLGLDRLDYSKGIPERLAAIERLFERRPSWRGEFTFVQKATPSRTAIPAYERHGEFVRDEVDRINARFATRQWDPIVYTEDVLPKADLCALYRNADVMVVSPVSDGMNLVAQEYVAASVDGDGALVLSEGAGAHDLLGEDAYTIAPADTDAFAERLADALSAPVAERRRRMHALRRRVFGRDLETWMASQFETMASLRAANDRPSERIGSHTPSA